MLGEQWNPQNTKVGLSVAKHLPCKMLPKTKLNKFSYRLGENERTDRLGFISEFKRYYKLLTQKRAFTFTFFTLYDNITVTYYAKVLPSFIH